MIGIKITGGPELAARLGQLPEAVSRRVQREALKRAAEPMRAEAARLAPSDPASSVHMADHILIATANPKADGAGEDATATVAVGPDRRFFYSSFQEFGTAKHPAQPFLRPAFEAQSSLSLNIVLAELWLSIRKRLGLGGGRSTSGGNL